MVCCHHSLVGSGLFLIANLISNPNSLLRIGFHIHALLLIPKNKNKKKQKTNKLINKKGSALIILEKPTAYEHIV